MKLLVLTESVAFPHAVSKRENGQPSLVERVLQNLGNAGGFDVVSSQDSRASISVEGLKEFDAVLSTHEANCRSPRKGRWHC